MQADVLGCNKGETETAEQMPKRSREMGFRGAEKSPEIGENENYQTLVHVPGKRVLCFWQILQGIFSTLQKVRQGHPEDPNGKKKTACEDLGRVEEGTREK